MAVHPLKQPCGNWHEPGDECANCKQIHEEAVAGVIKTFKDKAEKDFGPIENVDVLLGAGEITVIERHAKEWVEETKTFTYDELIDLFNEGDLVSMLAYRCKLYEAEIRRLREKDKEPFHVFGNNIRNAVRILRAWKEKRA